MTRDDIKNYCDDVRDQRDECIEIVASALADQDREAIDSAVDLLVTKHAALLDALKILKGTLQ